MDVDKTISEIEWLERTFALADRRPLGSEDLEAANRAHDQNYANNPWFRLWQRYGICTRSEPSPPSLYLGMKSGDLL